jgi:RNA-directed DNA polymerase
MYSCQSLYAATNLWIMDIEGLGGGLRRWIIEMKTILAHKFEDIISVDNLLEAWREFVKGKRNKRDVQDFQLNLMDNILSLQLHLANHTYKHGGYQAFNISDPKPRHIHKAPVRDRLLHHAIYRILYPFFDRVFVADSFSCRLNKGTHKAINHFRSFAYQASSNNTRTCWTLKCDIKKFFENINHVILKNILSQYVSDQDVLLLLSQVIDSFSAGYGRGLPLGNLTSQLFVNIYMNEFDQFIKHELGAKYYIRYADDFVVLSKDKVWLRLALSRIGEFLDRKLHLKLHQDKISIRTITSGVDFLGWVNFPDHRVLRTTTRRRMFKKISCGVKKEVADSYLGMLEYGNGYNLKRKVLETIDENLV